MTSSIPTTPGPRPADNPDVRRTVLAACAVALGMLTLNCLLSDRGWVLDAVLTVAVVAVPTALLRVWRRPGAFDVWLGVALLIPWLTLRFVPDHALLGLLPTHGTVDDISRLSADLRHTTKTEPAPVHSTPAIRLVVCALIGLVTALVDLVAVVGRRGALAGIPLLVVFTVSGAIARQAVAWGWFACAAAGFLLLLSLDATDRRTSWGYRVASTSGPERTWSRTAPLLGVIAVLLAVVIPFLTPLPSRNLLARALNGRHGGGSSQFGAGSSGDSGKINPFAALKGQLVRGRDVDLMTVHVLGAGAVSIGSTQVPFYLRTNVLDTFTSAGWRESDHGAEDDIRTSSLYTDPNDEQPASTLFHVDITVSGLTSNPPTFTKLTEVGQVSDGTRWSSQDQLLLGPAVPRGTTIEETFNQADPTAQDLRSAPSTNRDELRKWLAKPTLPGYVTSLVRTLTAGKTTAYDKARALNDYFTAPANGFLYSLVTTDGDSGSDLVDFLRNKQGYCQQFAAAEAIMLRQAGIPSRVVLGYMHEPPDRSGNFTVTSHDAHAWVEAYFPGAGWIPFDPTPASGLTGGAESDLAWAPHHYQRSSGVNDPSRPATGSASSAPVRPSVAPSPASSAVAVPGSSGTSRGSGWATPLIVLGGVVVLVGLVLTPAAVRVARRRRRWAAAGHGDVDALWQELTDTAVDLGYVWSPARSPRQVAAWLGDHAGHDAPALGTLATLVEQGRYAPNRRPDASATSALIAPMQAATGHMRQRRGRRTRIRAAVLPASLGWTGRLRRH